MTKFVDTIYAEAVKNALMKWNNRLTKEEAIKKTENLGSVEEAEKEVVYGSVDAAIKGLANVLGLEQEEEQEVIELLTKNVKEQDKINDDLKERIKTLIEEKGIYKIILATLSNIHDEWVKKNGNKFCARDKNYQFVPLALLPFSEVESDLLFLKPILNALSFEINEKDLEREFGYYRNFYMQRKYIFNMEFLYNFIKSGSIVYDALKNVTTNRGKEGGKKELIDDILENEPDVARRMVVQIVEEAKIFGNIDDYSKTL